MKPLSHTDAYQVLWLQLADDGRQSVLLGDRALNARMAVLPFMVGEKFPNVYFEFPLAGDPFLDVTVLYDRVAPGTRVESEAAAGTDGAFDWYAVEKPNHANISFGFELDTSNPELPRAAVHFQPRASIELVEPFCESIGEQEKGKLYLAFAKRMPKGWDLSFFGMFRGRPDSPLRICGYLNEDEKVACANDPGRLAAVFDEIGFKAYDATMLEQISVLLGMAPRGYDFQFDVLPDGSLTDVFAIDVQFDIEQPQVVRGLFKDGPIADLFGKLQEWGIADERWKLGADIAFARALPVELDDGSVGRYSLTVFPQWAKVRWRNGVLDPAKLYCYASAGILDKQEEDTSPGQ